MRNANGRKNIWSSFLVRLSYKWREIFGFFGIFLALSIPLYILIYTKADFTFAQTEVARQVAFLSRLIGNPAVSEGYLVRSGNVVLEVIEACVAWKDIFAFIALVLAVPNRTIRAKAIGIVLGSIGIYFANLARLLTVLIVAIKEPSLAEVVHSVLWKFGMISIILVFWIVWMLASGKGINKEKTSRAE